ncbi:MAG: thiamine ABC transporter substrate-binding protein [Spirochaetaceae bacterium]|jgi:thiamine transport system substrate-binding protein|nr:thiamine ABC transporter substrate-binding protein [Spirochaetaceae bacterium]
MKKAHILFIVLIVFVFCACSKKESASSGTKLVIWTYDSFTSEWGPGAAIARNFKEESGFEIQWESAGDAGSLLARLLLEGSGANADIVLGLDQNLAPRALKSGLFEAYIPKNAKNLIADIGFNGDFRLIPYDYSYFALIYDSEKIEAPPSNLEALCDAKYKQKLILMDPRTSSPGLGFFVWTKAIYGNQWQDYWKRLLPSVLTIAAGWDEGYGLFTKGEAPLVLSYTTSPAYHAEYEKSTRYKAALFKDGHPLQTEFAGLLVNAKAKEAAKQFLEFMLSRGFQKEIPLGNWMYPVIDIELPVSFNEAPKPAKAISSAPVSDEEINAWAELVRSAR